MTVGTVGEANKSGGALRRFTVGWIWAAVSPILLLAVVFFALFLSTEAAEYAISGMTLAVTAVIPSAFPSMLLCDLYRRFGYPEKIPFFGRVFRWLFGINSRGLRAFVLGNLCGFPTGAREVGAAYSEGVISREEAELLLPLSTNPSPAFIIGAVGGALLGDTGRGGMLLLCVMLSSVVVGVVYRKKRCEYSFSPVVFGQSYSIVESIRSSGAACITVISFISAFSVALGFIKKYVNFLPLKCLLFGVLEATGGVNFFIKEFEFSPAFSGALVAFSLGFGGVSVMLQSAALASDFGLKIRGYFKIKLTQGIIAAVLFFVINLLI